MTATEKLAKILEVLKAGKTIYVQTTYRAWKITAKDVATFEAANRPLLKVNGNSLYMAVGKRYDCIDYCAFKVVNR